MKVSSYFLLAVLMLVSATLDCWARQATTTLAETTAEDEDVTKELEALLDKMDEEQTARKRSRPHVLEDEKVINKALKLATLLEQLDDEEKAAEDALYEEYVGGDEESTQDDGEFENFLATLLASMDRRNPYVLRRSEIEKLRPTSSPANKKLPGMLRMAIPSKKPQEDALQPEPEKDSAQPNYNAGLLAFGIISFVVAVLMAIVAGVAMFWVRQQRREDRHMPISMSPKLPLFSPKDGLSTIYRNRKFRIHGRRDSEGESRQMPTEREEEFRRQQQELQQKSPEIDEVHLGANDFLDASLSSI